MFQIALKIVLLPFGHVEHTHLSLLNSSYLSTPSNLQEAVKYEIAPLPDNPTVAQIKTHKERKTRKSKALACLFTAVSSNIFTRIMSLESAKEIWDHLKTEYKGDERIRGMQMLNLVREFKMKRMKESETIKEYSDRLLNLANCIRLLGSSFNDSRIIWNPCCRTSAGLQEIQKTTGSSSTEEKLKVGGMSTSKSCSSGKIKAYGEVTTKRLCESFKEKNYPDCDAREKFEQSGGWIKVLPEEAENERMHLMTMESIHSYTLYLNDIDRGEIENFPAPAIAMNYWRLPKNATVKDVDEAYHRDVNHFASSWETYQADLSIDLRKYHVPKKFLNKVTYWSVKLLRIPTNLFFKEIYGCHAMMLETVAGVPGMVGGILLHLRLLRKFELLCQRIGVCIS
ncbi:Ubiquinol oxidase, mitochondrial [Capsicum annuum]|nr:Ubiquinol oxidase, mitochondrial [Capsicum annuum]